MATGLALGSTAGGEAAKAEKMMQANTITLLFGCIAQGDIGGCTPMG